LLIDPVNAPQVDKALLELDGAGDALDLLQSDLVGRAVIQVRGPWRLMSGKRLGDLQRAAVLRVDGDPATSR